MSTIFLRTSAATLFIAAIGCGGGRSQTPTPSGQKAADPSEREWKRITVGGPYGEFEMAVPVITISPANDAPGSIVVDSTALHEVEKRLTARMAGIARAQAGALFDSVSAAPRSRNPAPLIRAGLLGEIPFEADSLRPTSEGTTRVQAVAGMLRELAGRIEVSATVAGTGAARFDVANARARRVYLALLEAQPGLAEREVQLTVRTYAVLPGAPVPLPVVGVYYSPQ